MMNTIPKNLEQDFNEVMRGSDVNAGEVMRTMFLLGTASLFLVSHGLQVDPAKVVKEYIKLH